MTRAKNRYMRTKLADIVRKTQIQCQNHGGNHGGNHAWNHGAKKFSGMLPRKWLYFSKSARDLLAFTANKSAATHWPGIRRPT